MEVVSDDRRRAASPAAAPRELPILFHLMDVSRPRNSQRASVLSPASTEVEAAIHPAVMLAPEPSPVVAPIAHAPAAATVSSHWDDIQLPQPQFNHFHLQSGENLTPPATIQVPEPLASAAEPVASPPPALPVARESETPQPPPADQTVTPRAVTPSGRRLKTPATEDWFAAHGKFIAAAFVLALIGTIYFARTTRREVATDAAAAPVSPLVELDPSNTKIEPAPPLAAAPASAIAAPALATPPADTAPAATSKAELHIPSAPQLASNPATNQPISSDNLFVFPAGKKTDERVATVPHFPSPQVNPFAASTSQSAPPPTATTPTYPVTASPSLYQGMTTPAPAPSYTNASAPPLQSAARPQSPSFVTPASNTSPPLPPVPAQPANSQFPQPGGPRPQAAWSPPAWSPSAAGIGQPGPYQSPDNIARGPRYERTGSGNY